MLTTSDNHYHYHEAFVRHEHFAIFKRQKFIQQLPRFRSPTLRARNTYCVHSRSEVPMRQKPMLGPNVARLSID
jgi:hypothetical protein